MKKVISKGLMALIFVFLFIPYAFSSTLQLPKKAINVGVLVDGDSRSFSEIFEQLKSEIKELTQEEYNIVFSDRNIISGDWNISKIKENAQKLLDNSKIDMVIAIGIGASNAYASMERNFPKPVIATLILYPRLQGLKTGNGKSNKHNFVYNTPENNLERNIKIFKSVVEFKHLSVLVEQMVCDSLNGYRQMGKKAEKDFGIKINVIGVGNSASKAIEKLPSGTDAVIVSPLLRLTNIEKQKLSDELISKKIPGFSMWSRKEVENGLLAGASPESEFSRLIRRTAINIQRIILGEKPEELQVNFFAHNALSINMKTAKKLGISPNWKVMNKAELLHYNEVENGEKISLKEAISKAVKSNFRVNIQKASLKIAEENVKAARSYLIPSLKVSATALEIDKNRAEYSFNIESERKTYYSAELNQVLFSEKAWAGYTSLKHAEKSSKHEFERTIEDISYETANAYINVLKAEALERITKNTLNLTRANLKRANLRKAVGIARPSEVHRWESEIAAIKMEVNAAEVKRQSAYNALKRLMNSSQKNNFKVLEVTEDSRVLFTSKNKAIINFVSNPSKFEIFKDFMVKEGIKNSPLIKKIDEGIKAKKRMVNSAKRAHYLPEVVLQGKYEDIIDRGGYDEVLSAFDEKAWSIAMNVSFPLFSGGRIQAEYIKAVKELRKMEYSKKLAIQSIDEKIRFAANNAGISYEAIQLSKNADTAAGKNLGIVTEAYTRGAVSVINLLDAQNSKMKAEIGSANAVYDYVLAVITLQRSIGKTDFSVNPEDRSNLFEKLVKYADSIKMNP